MAGGFRIAEWTVEPQLNSLERNGHTIRVEPKVMQVLVCLAGHQGELVSKEQLMRTVWADTFVTEEVLTRSISELRKSFNDDPKNPRFIETIPKSGYLLIPEVQPLVRPPTMESSQPKGRAARWSLGAALVILAAIAAFVIIGQRNQWFEGFGHNRRGGREASQRSIAVLPLENLSGDPSQEYFADGMTDELITNLAKIESLRVISRTSVMQYKQIHKPLPDIARALNVELIVEGTVSRSGDQVRINAQLIDGKTDAHLWAQDFERDPQNVLKLESEIAQAIASEIRVQLTKEDGTRLNTYRPVGMKVQDIYLRGRFQWNKRTRQSLYESIRLYQQALAADPHYAPAYAAMADSYILLENEGELSPTEGNPRSRDAAVKAVEEDPGLAEAHMVLADSLERNWDWAGAEREYRRAIELNPGLARVHHWYAILLSNMNRPDEAIREIQRAVELDPLSERLYIVKADIYYSERQYEQAMQVIRLVEGAGAETKWDGGLAGKVALAQKRFPEAITKFQALAKSEPEEPESWALLTYAYAQGGERENAQQAFAKLNRLSQHRYVAPVWIAVAWTGLGDRDKAISLLTEACRIKSSILPVIQSDPLFDPLRSDPRFAELLHEIALPARPAKTAGL
jgi:TolB-like protein/DNA-binding winged helix-turn-helix (wHTH) protein/Flp pilus assembly protein TadD